VVPAISRPVRFLLENKQNYRADVVAYDYSFSWASALVAYSAMILLTLILSLLANDNDRRQLRMLERSMKRQFDGTTKMQGFAALLSMPMVYVFFEAFWGDFEFRGYRSLANMVHVRDSDLYKIGFYLFLFLFLSTGFLVWGAKKLALKNGSHTSSSGGSKNE
jgi:hypothetical protein